MDSLKIIHEQRLTRAEVIKLGEYPHSDIVCRDLDTESQFTLDPFVGAENKQIFKIGDVFEAVVHPVDVTFAVLDWVSKP